MGTDRFTIRAVVLLLGFVAVMGMGLGGWLALTDHGTPDFIISTTSGAIGALGALLARTSSEPAPVTVENEDPVEVVETPPPVRRRGG